MQAKTLYELGYRKISKNAVVLTGMERENLFAELLTEFDEYGFEPTITMPNAEEYAREWKRKLIYAIGQLRKETAEKFAERVKKLFETSYFIVGCGKLYDEIDEICKELMEERK